MQRGFVGVGRVAKLALAVGAVLLGVGPGAKPRLRQKHAQLGALLRLGGRGGGPDDAAQLRNHIRRRAVAFQIHATARRTPSAEGFRLEPG